MGCPSDRTMLNIMKGRLLKNCMVNEDDVINARNIFGPEIAAGKKARRRAANVDLRFSVPSVEIMRRKSDATACFDIMYVNGIPFLVSISHNIKFCTAEAVENDRMPQYPQA